MPLNHLLTYLHDHLAGALAAVEIIDHIEVSHGDTAAGDVIRKLRTEILDDRNVLMGLIERLGDTAQSPRRIFGWLAEKSVELKLKLDDPSGGALRLFESAELLSLGIEGKISLWYALDAGKQQAPPLQSLDYARLISRAREQRAMLETVRLDAARAAFS